DLIVFLTAGKMLYIGPPGEAPAFFGAADLGDVYSTVEDETMLDHWEHRCLDSNGYEKFVLIRQGSSSSEGRVAGYTPTPTVPKAGNVGLSALRQFLLL